MSNKIDIQNAIAMLHSEGYEITKPKIEVKWLDQKQVMTGATPSAPIFEFETSHRVTHYKFPAIKQAIESALNDTVVEDRFDGKRASFYAMDEVGQWAAADKELTKEKIDELMKEFHNQPLQFYSPPKRYSQSEVDAIRADTWYAARKITDKVVGEIDFKDGDRCPFYEKYFNSINDYLSSLNLNSNDTGKEDNETKSANWRSENLSKQSAPEPSALPNKEWEIVSFVSIHGEVLTLDEKKWKYRSETSSISDMDFLLKHYSIHSVRRLSDNTVFSVGDSYDGGYKITAFKITGTTMMYECNDNECFYNIAGLRIPDSQKPPITDLPKQQVVEDKPPLSYHWAVQKNTFHLLDGIIYPLSKPEDWETFSTLEAAEQYIDMNKKQFSKNDIINSLK